MIKTTELILNFVVIVTPNNLHLVKNLSHSTMIQELPDDIEIGDEIPIDFTLEGDFSDHALNMAMLFNSSLKTKPFIKIVREQKSKDKKLSKSKDKWEL